jgi:hypothetical protein
MQSGRFAICMTHLLSQPRRGLRDSEPRRRQAYPQAQDHSNALTYFQV